MKEELSGLKEFLAALIYPRPCARCSQETSRVLCASCLDWVRSQTQCLCCAGNLENGSCLCCADSYGLGGFRTLFPYEEVKSFVVQGKHDSHTQRDREPELMTLIPAIFHQDSDVAFVPSRSKAHWLEKFFVSQDKEVSRPLIKNPWKVSQKFRTRENRMVESGELFFLASDFSRRCDKVLLIDDVLSTGASFKACVSLLSHLGYREINGFVLAFRNRRETR